MKIGYTGWTWISNEFDDWNPINERHKENFERYLRDISDLGYETAENFNWIADYYADDIEGFKQVVNKYGLKFENLYFYFSDDPEKDILGVPSTSAAAAAPSPSRRRQGLLSFGDAIELT